MFEWPPGVYYYYRVVSIGTSGSSLNLAQTEVTRTEPENT